MAESTNKDKLKLGICLPWDSPFMYTQFVMSALNLQPPAGYTAHYYSGHGWCPARRHADACEQAIADDCELLCILGADQTYPPDMLTRLVARWQALGGIIGALVPFRGFCDWNDMAPFQPMAWRLEAENTLDDAGNLCVTERREVVRPEDGPVQRAHLIGTGVTLFHRDVYLAVKEPRFYERVEPRTMHRVADQDSHFIVRMQIEGGAPLHVDTTIEVKHLHIFAIDGSFQRRFADWADPATDSDRAICRFRAELPTTGG